MSRVLDLCQYLVTFCTKCRELVARVTQDSMSCSSSFKRPSVESPISSRLCDYRPQDAVRPPKRPTGRPIDTEPLRLLPQAKTTLPKAAPLVQHQSLSLLLLLNHMLLLLLLMVNLPRNAHPSPIKMHCIVATRVGFAMLRTAKAAVAGQRRVRTCRIVQQQPCVARDGVVRLPFAL
jgi:hypothetical protein